MSISALLHSISLSFSDLTPVAHIAHEGVTRIKAGKYTKKIRNNKVFTLIFKHLRIVRFTQQMLAHHSLPTSHCEKPCFDAHKVKRQVMHTKHIIPSYNFSHQPLSGDYTAHCRSNPRATPQHSTTYDTLHEIFLQHITLPHAPLRGSYCTRSTFPHSERHNTRALYPYKADIACNRYSLTATPSPWHHTTNWHLTINILP